MKIPRIRRHLFDTLGSTELNEPTAYSPLTGFTRYQISKMSTLPSKQLVQADILRLIPRVSDLEDPVELFEPEATLFWVKALLRFKGLSVLIGRRPSHSLKQAQYLTHRFDWTCYCGKFGISRVLRRWCPSCGVSEINILERMPSLNLPTLPNSKFQGIGRNWIP